MKFKLFVVLVAIASLSSSSIAVQKNGSTSVAATTGQAIGEGVKAFMSSTFPSGSALLTLVQSWLSKKLNNEQKQDLTTKADAQKQTIDSNLSSAKTKIQTAADTLKLTSVVLYHTNNAASELSAMLAILDTSSTASLPFSQLNEHWNNVKGELSALKDDNVLQNARSAITDTAVANALQGLDNVTRGPIANVNDNLKPAGNKAVLRANLTKILNASVDFNNLGVILLGSTGTEITRAINDVTKAGGQSQLDQTAASVVSKANTKLEQQIGGSQQ